MPKPDGGPAFPKPDVIFNGSYEYGPSGMSLRQWFAGTAPEAITDIDGLSLDNCCEILDIPKGTYEWREHYPLLLAKLRFRYADAMIAEMEKNV